MAEALPRALADEGHDVRVFVPLYGVVDRERHGLELQWETPEFRVFAARIERSEVPVYFVDCPKYFARASIYTNDVDEPERFVFFCRAVLESCQRLSFAPHVVHANDWQSALLPLLLKTTFSWDQLFAETKTLLTIHNIGYQGSFGVETLRTIGVEDRTLFDADDLRNGVVNFLKTGVVHAGHLSTVSPTYAREIQTPEQGFGLDPFLAARNDALTGILNGVDYDEWSPAADHHIPYRYAANDLEGKRRNKLALLEQLGLECSVETPLVGMVTRLSYQKGIDLLPNALPSLLAEQDFAFAVLGTGEAKYEEFFASLQSRFPGRVCFFRGFENRLAHWIEAGADLFLMPSRYEPCGLNQMYSLKYGTVPIVRKTGGLADSVVPFDPATGEGTGIVFEHYTPDGVHWAIGAGIALYRDPEAHARVVANGMAQDFSWAGPAKRYVAIYRDLLIH